MQVSDYMVIDPPEDQEDREPQKEPEWPAEPNAHDVNQRYRHDRAINTMTPEEQSNYNNLVRNWRYKTDRVQRLFDNLNSIHNLMIQTVQLANAPELLSNGTVYDDLIAIRDFLAPTDKATEMEVIKQYKDLLQGPSQPKKKEKVEEWLLEWETVHRRAVTANIADIQHGRDCMDFCTAVQRIYPQWSTYWEFQHQQQGLEMKELITNFREQYRKHLLTASTSQKGAAFGAALQNHDTDGHPVEIEGWKKPCFCGYKHRWEDCWYFNRYTRPEGWQPNPKTLQKIKAATKRLGRAFEVAKANIERNNKQGLYRRATLPVQSQLGSGHNQQVLGESSLPPAVAAVSTPSTRSSHSSMAMEQPATPAPSGSQPPSKNSASSASVFALSINAASLSALLKFRQPEAFSLPQSVTATGQYPLHNSWILDSGATMHLTNNRDAYLPGKYTKLSPESLEIFSGGTLMQVQGIGDVQIKLDAGNGQLRTITLQNTVHVPNFHTNCVSWDLLEEGGLEWDTKGSRLTFNGQTFCTVYKAFRQRVLVLDDPLTEEPISASFAAQTTSSAAFPFKSHVKPTSTVSAHRWHQRLGHIGPETVMHLEQAAEGVKIASNTVPPFTVECDTCASSKAKRIVRRVPLKRAKRPFERIFFDVTPFPENFEGYKCLLQFTDSYSSYRWCYPLKDFRIFGPIKQFVAMVKTQFGRKVKIFHSDNDAGLRKAWKKWLKDEGIQWDTTPIYTPDQNGPAERSGHLITEHARSLRIQANFPERLWPYLTRTAVWLLNRTPVQSLNWITPYEMLHSYFNPSQSNKPYLGGLITIGAKAFPLRRGKEFENQHKLAPKAHIGHLLGYQATNIFAIWIPSREEVVFTRDVRFNENQLYDPREEDLASSTRERIENLIGTIEKEEILQPEPQYQAISSDTDSSLHESSDAQGQSDQEVDLFKEPEIPTPFRDNYAPRAAEITAETDSRLIQSSRFRPTRQAKWKHAIHALHLAKLHHESGINAAFAAALKPRTRPQLHRLHRSQVPPPPKHWGDLKRHAFGKQFKQAAYVEFEELGRKETYRVISRPLHVLVLPLLWVFTYKFDADGYVAKFKARLCVRGDLQPLTSDETYAATLASRVFRFMMALVAAFDLETHHYDAVNAFLNSMIDRTTYVSPPPGFHMPNQVLQLLKALYGLRQSPKLWWQLLSQILQKFGLTPANEEVCLFSNGWLIVFFYVDDLIALYHKRDQEKFNAFHEYINREIKLRDLGEVSWFLGVRVTRDRAAKKLWLSQDAYIDKISNKYKVATRAIYTPLPSSDLTAISPQSSPSSDAIYFYQQRVGSLQYAATITRPDIAKATALLAEFSQKPAKEHEDAVTQVLQYLAHTKELSIQYHLDPEQSPWAAFADASFGDDSRTRKSSNGYLIILFGGPIDWQATRQKSVTTSSTEAELHALSTAVRNVIWWKRLFQTVTFDPFATPYGTGPHGYTAGCDNLQTIRLLTAQTPKLHTKLRHVDIYHHWLREKVQEGEIDIEHVPTGEMIADGLTKPLPRQKHEAFVRQLNLTKPPMHENQVTAAISASPNQINDAALESLDSQIGSDADSETATASNQPQL